MRLCTLPNIWLVRTLHCSSLMRAGLGAKPDDYMRAKVALSINLGGHALLRRWRDLSPPAAKHRALFTTVAPARIGDYRAPHKHRRNLWILWKTQELRLWNLWKTPLRSLLAADCLVIIGHVSQAEEIGSIPLKYAF